MTEQVPRFSVREFLILAAPLIVSRAGLSTMSMIDSVMVSWSSTQDLAYLSLAIGTQERLLGVLAVFPMSGLALIPRFFGKKDYEGAHLLWLRTLWIDLALGALALFVGFSGTPLLTLMGQSKQLVTGAAPVMELFAIGGPAALLAVSTAVYLEGVNRPREVAMLVVGANVLNIALNWILIWGHLGLPAMGAFGSALSTTMVRFSLAATFVAIAWRMRPKLQVGTTDRENTERDDARRLQFRMGASAISAAAVGAPLSACMTMFAGWLGSSALAAFAGTWNLLDPGTLLLVGLADASGILMAAQAGRYGERAVNSVCAQTLGVTLGMVAVVVLFLELAPDAFARFYSGDSALRDSITSLLPLAALLLLVNGVGHIMAAALRAFRDPVWPSAVDFVSLAIMVPLAAVCTQRLGWGVWGLFFASVISAFARATLMTLRYRWLTTTRLRDEASLSREDTAAC